MTFVTKKVCKRFAHVGNALLLLGYAYLASANDASDEAPSIPMYQEVYHKAMQGDAESQTMMGELYRHADGVEQDYKKAYEWYYKAAKQGYGPAQDNVGIFHARGIVVEMDCAEAAKWFRYASFNGSKTARGNLSWTLATCHKDNVRDGDMALAMAQEDIAEQGISFSRLDNLAAAYAEMGQFDKAIEIQQIIVENYGKILKNKRFEGFQDRLTAYQNGHPWRTQAKK